MAYHFAELLEEDSDVGQRPELVSVIVPADTMDGALREILDIHSDYRPMLARTLSPQAEKFLDSIPSDGDTDALCLLRLERIQEAVSLVEACALKIVQTNNDLPALLTLQNCATFGRTSSQFLEDCIADDNAMLFHMYRGTMIDYFALAIRDHITMFVEHALDEWKRAAHTN